MREEFKDNIVKEIERRGLEPTARFHFLLKRSVFWSLAVLAAILGGIASSIIIFVFFDNDPMARQYLHSSWTRYILLSIPYFWLGIFALFVAAARHSLRHTKTGYRHATTKIVTLVILISLSLGFLLNVFDFGQKINDFLSDAVPFYDNLVYTSRNSWSHPEQGLLGGKVMSVSSGGGFILHDFNNKTWHIYLTQGESDDFVKNIKYGDMLKIVGSDNGAGSFTATQIYYWKN